jgi:hypothetical protein
VSLADLLVALTGLALVLGALLGSLEHAQRLYGAGAAKVEAQQSARVGLERMAREIRQAGYGAPELPAITLAERSRIVLHLDADGDGAFTAARETITWSVSGRVLRRNAGGGAQPIVSGVRDLALAYFDARGAPTMAPVDVRTVLITLVTEPERLLVDPTQRALATFTTQVRLRNR